MSTDRNTAPCGHSGSSFQKQWCPDEKCCFHIKHAKCVMVDEHGNKCKNFTQLNREGTARNPICYYCHKFCRENHVCVTPGCNRETTPRPDGSGYYWPVCSTCFVPKENKERDDSGKSWSASEEADPIANCVFCGSDKIREGYTPVCEGCQSTIKKNDPDFSKFMWKGTCIGHRNPQFGNTVTCSVCCENQRQYYTNKCDQCGHWLSSQDACSLCTGKQALEFKKVTKSTQGVKVTRLDLGQSKPVNPTTSFKEILKREPSKEVSDDESKGSSAPPPSPAPAPVQVVRNPPPVPVEVPIQVAPVPIPVEVPIQVPAPIQVQEKVKVSFKSEYRNSTDYVHIMVTAFGKTAVYHLLTGNYEADQEDGVYTVKFQEFGGNPMTLRIITDQVTKTISFAF